MVICFNELLSVRRSTPHALAGILYVIRTSVYVLGSSGPVFFLTAFFGKQDTGFTEYGYAHVPYTYAL